MRVVRCPHETFAADPVDCKVFGAAITDVDAPLEIFFWLPGGCAPNDWAVAAHHHPGAAIARDLSDGFHHKFEVHAVGQLYANSEVLLARARVGQFPESAFSGCFKSHRVFAHRLQLHHLG